MEIFLDRDVRTKKTTQGILYIDGVFECYILEDLDRGLKSSMSMAQIAAIKVPATTAIPEGRYKVIVNRSNRFKRMLPLLIDVPGFSGIRIHSGNKAQNTEGCLLPGTIRTIDFIGNSKIAFDRLFKKIFEAQAKEIEVFITIKW
ncbi:MAG: hypothetical protein EAZ35_02175 [Sphingobacteriia bacterium]|nr:MAG: hypothetical protein EAZ35_02175 [Sphingobacteriia bacterium]